MLTEEKLSVFTLDQLAHLLRDKLVRFEQIQEDRVDRKTCELARIELDLIEYVIDQRTLIRKP